jgi:hypothetical protein
MVWLLHMYIFFDYEHGKSECKVMSLAILVVLTVSSLARKKSLGVI